MDQRTQGALLLAVGGVALRLGLTDAALSYVKATLQPWLTATGLVLVVLGATAVWEAFRADRAPVDSEDVARDDRRHHDHTLGPGVAWFLVLPLLALLLVAPPPLGAFAAGRQSTRPPATTQSSYPPLPEAEDGAVPLTVSEFVFRALYDPDRSLDDERIRLVGFVTPSEDEADDYLLTRFRVACCAADGQAIHVAVRGDAYRRPDTWLEVEGHWEPRPGVEPGHPSPDPPVFVVESVREVDAPAQPYEY